MKQRRILVVDDEQDLCEILLYNLTSAGYETVSACSAEEALQIIDNGQAFDLFLLDVMMPGLSGFELAERLKQNQLTARVPIIFLTAKDTEDDTLRGFNHGADDYITKPFFVREVVARVRAVLGRSLSNPTSSRTQAGTASTDGNGFLSHEGLKMDGASKRVTIDGEAVALTRTEFELLNLLLSHCGQVLSRQELLDGAWPQDVIVTERTVDVNIARLRKKIGRYAVNIVARQGFGYCFEPGENTK